MYVYCRRHYWRGQINQTHDDFLQHKVMCVNTRKTSIMPSLKKVPVLTLDCNQEFEADVAQFEHHLSAVKNFIQQTTQLHAKQTSVHKALL